MLLYATEGLPVTLPPLKYSHWLLLTPSRWRRHCGFPWRIAVRKQVRPDTSAFMPNVAMRKHRALFWPCQVTSAQARGCFLLWVRASGEVNLSSVFIADVVGRSCQVDTCWWSSKRYWHGYLGPRLYLKLRRAYLCRRIRLYQIYSEKISIALTYFFPSILLFMLQPRH